MPASKQTASRRRASVLGADRALRGQLAAQLRALGRYEVTEGEPEAFFARKPGTLPDLVVLDVGDGALLEDPRLAAARDGLENRPIIVVSEVLPPERVRQMVRLRAADWLQKPLSDADFAASLAQVEGAIASAEARVSAFVGASGGAGATTLALMAAQYFAARGQPGDTAIVDLDFQSASCSAYLNVSKEFDLDPLLASPERLDAELLDAIRLERAPGIALYGFERPELYFSPAARAFVLKLLDVVSVRHRNVIIDLPNLATPWFDDVVVSSDYVFVVFEVNVPSLRQARRTVRHVRELRGERGGVVPVANKAAFKLFGNTVSRGDVGKMLGDAKYHVVGRDDELATDALNRALLPGEISPRARLVREAGKLFGSVLGK